MQSYAISEYSMAMTHRQVEDHPIRCTAGSVVGIRWDLDKSGGQWLGRSNMDRRPTSSVQTNAEHHLVSCLVRCCGAEKILRPKEQRGSRFRVAKAPPSDEFAMIPML